MDDHEKTTKNKAIAEITPELGRCLNETRAKLKGPDRRRFMAQIASALGPGGQARAHRELGWNRNVIIKGIKELESDIRCIDNFSGRGRKPAEHHLPHLLEDIRCIVEPVSQVDPTFRTDQNYCPLTAGEVRRRLIDDKHYSDEELPKERTIRTKLDELGYKPQKVTKSKPLKKDEHTDAIFENVHFINYIADESPGVIRVSIDTKATIKVGPFSRGGYNRQGTKAADHDFDPETTLRLFGIHNPQRNENHLYLTKGSATADFMVDAIEDFRSSLENRDQIHTMVINADNGPENSSRRTQFIKRIVEFAESGSIDVNLAYYPPYHSKYNSIERVWGVLENHWRGQLLDSVDKVIGLAKTMKWKGKNPVVKVVDKVYETGVRLSKSAMKTYEKMMVRMSGLENWFVDIPCFEQ